MKRSKIVINKPATEIIALPIAGHGCIVEVQQKFTRSSHNMLMIVTATEDYYYLTGIGGDGMMLKVKPERACGLVIGNTLNVEDKTLKDEEYKIIGMCDVEINVTDIRRLY